jgi:alkyl hydroperoxide reductase subunit AhpC
LSNPIIYDIDKMLSKKFTGSENGAYLESMNRFYIVDSNSFIRQIITFQKEVSIDLNDIYMVINSLRDTTFHKVLRD